jgi:hypothetical protein
MTFVLRGFFGAGYGFIPWKTNLGQFEFLNQKTH